MSALAISDDFSGGSSNHRNRTVIVAMITVRMMQVSFYKVVNMIAMGNGLVTATRTVLVTWIVTGTGMSRRASGRIRVSYFQFVLDDAAVIGHVVQVTIVQIVDMVTMLNTSVFAIGTMLVVVVFVCVSHRIFSGFERNL